MEGLQGVLTDLETTMDSPEPMQVAPKPNYAPKHTWLPQFQRFLPGSWADPNLISAKAAKADNAKVATSMWDDRIGLIFPTWTPNRLDALRRGVLQWQCRRLYLEFVAYMRNRHGVTWLAQLRMLRLETCKWSRGSTDPTIHARKRVKGGSMKTLKDHPLLKDGTQGAQALSHFMRHQGSQISTGVIILEDFYSNIYSEPRFPYCPLYYKRLVDILNPVVDIYPRHFLRNLCMTDI